MTDVLLELGERRALLTVDRAGSRNAIGVATIAELEDALNEVQTWQSGNSRAVALLVTGAGRAFVSGGDLHELRQMQGYEASLAFSTRMQSILNQLEDLPIPVVAALNGPAVGGGSELALACDARVMAEDAYLSFAQARLGVVTGWGGAGRLIQLLGRRRALTLLATAGRVEADQAEIMGLADWLAPPGRALERAEAIVDRMAELPPLAIRALKPLLRRVDCSDRDASQLAEREAFAALWNTRDHEEALAALLDGRAPDFQGT